MLLPEEFPADLAAECCRSCRDEILNRTEPPIHLNRGVVSP